MSIDLDEVRARLSARGQAARPAEVADALTWLGYVVSDAAVLETVAALRRESQGAGPLDDLLRLPGVTDVLVNGPDDVWIDRGGGSGTLRRAVRVGGGRAAAGGPARRTRGAPPG